MILDEESLAVNGINPSNLWAQEESDCPQLFRAVGRNLTKVGQQINNFEAWLEPKEWESGGRGILAEDLFEVEPQVQVQIDFLFEKLHKKLMAMP